MAGKPYQPPRECEDALAFIARQENIDVLVAEVLNEKHRKEAEAMNKTRTKFPPLTPGQKVWYRRPEGSGSKNMPGGWALVW